MVISQLTGSQKVVDGPENRPIVPAMDQEPTPTYGRKNGSLKSPDLETQREVIRQWRRTMSGMDGGRGSLPETPDETVAYKLLEAADYAMSRGDWQKGVNILRLVIRDYRESKEAACALSVIDRLAERRGTHGR